MNPQTLQHLLDRIQQDGYERSFLSPLLDYAISHGHVHEQAFFQAHPLLTLVEETFEGNVALVAEILARTELVPNPSVARSLQYETMVEIIKTANDVDAIPTNGLLRHLPAREMVKHLPHETCWSMITEEPWWHATYRTKNLVSFTVTESLVAALMGDFIRPMDLFQTFGTTEVLKHYPKRALVRALEQSFVRSERCREHGNRIDPYELYDATRFMTETGVHLFASIVGSERLFIDVLHQVAKTLDLTPDTAILPKPNAIPSAPLTQTDEPHGPFDSRAQRSGFQSILTEQLALTPPSVDTEKSPRRRTPPKPRKP